MESLALEIGLAPRCDEATSGPRSCLGTWPGIGGPVYRPVGDPLPRPEPFGPTASPAALVKPGRLGEREAEAAALSKWASAGGGKPAGPEAPGTVSGSGGKEPPWSFAGLRG